MKATTLLLRRHRTLEQLVDAIAYERHLRRPFIEELADELSAHLAAHERVLDPILGELAPSVQARLDDLRARTRRTLDALAQAKERGEAAYERAADELCALAREYMELDLQLLIPAFETTLDGVRLEQLGNLLHREQLVRAAATT